MGTAPPAFLQAPLGGDSGHRVAWATASLTTPQPPGASRAASLGVSVVRVVSGSDNTVSTVEAGQGVLDEEEPPGWMGSLCPRIWEGEGSCGAEKHREFPCSLLGLLLVLLQASL